MWIRGVEAWVDPAWPVASHELRVSGEHDANEELAEWLGGDLIDDLIVADADASPAREGPKTLTEAAAETFSLSFSATIEGTLTESTPELDLPQVGPELTDGGPRPSRRSFHPRRPTSSCAGVPPRKRQPSTASARRVPRCSGSASEELSSARWIDPSARWKKARAKSSPSRTSA